MEGPDHDPGIGGRDYGALILRHGAAFALPMPPAGVRETTLNENVSGEVLSFR